MNVDRILEALSAIVDRTDSADSDQAGLLLQQLYSSVVLKYTPLIKGLPALSKNVASDLVPLAVAVLQVNNEIKTNEDYKAAVKKSRQIRGRERQELLDIYIKAGFTRREAMAFVLLDSANNKVQSQQFTEGLPKYKSKE